MSFKQITIIGVGLLGGSLGLAARQRRLAGTIVGVGHRESTLRTAHKRGAVDRYTLDTAEGVRGADLVILATPVGLFGPTMRQAAPALAKGCVITDVGSTKRAVLEAVVPLVPRGCRFVGSHPIAGSEARSIDAARADLFEGALTVIVPTERSDPASMDAVEKLWHALGSHTRRLDAETHDRLLAESSHLPHAVAAALLHALSPEAETVTGKGFLDMTRIASGDPAMWRDILVTNADEVERSIDELEAALGELKKAMKRGDAEAVQRFLQEAKSRRDKLLGPS